MTLREEIVTDSFAGGGGASTGIEMALGRSPDFAINHDPEAVAMHRINHPSTAHHCQNIWQVDPLDLGNKGDFGLSWFSPDCKHFSKAKGAAPVKRNIRDLAWVVVLWAERVRPRVICLENVEEFKTWGPLAQDNKPDPKRKGETFVQFIGKLRNLGYRVQFRELRACDYGAPTIRKRLFMVARCDGEKIVWPKPTHGAPDDAEVIAGRKLPWRTAASIIDWSLDCPSIFLTREEGRAIGVNRPLADKTMARIAKGIDRYVIKAEKPFIVSLTHAGGDRLEDMDEPMKTVTGAHRGEKALVAPVIARTAWGEKDSKGKKRGRGDAGPDAPLPTMTGSPDFALVAPVVSYAQQGGAVRDPAEPLHTFTASPKDQNVLIAAHMTKFSENSIGHMPDEPLHTAMAGAPRHGVVAAYLAQHNLGHDGRPAEAPVSTILQSGSHQMVTAASMLNLKGSDRRMYSADEPARSVTSGGLHQAEVRAFLMKYYGTGEGQGLADALHSVTTKDRFGLVMVEGEAYEIVDIGMRMLSPRELFRAQGFPDSYIIDRALFGDDGNPVTRALTKTAQVRMCGNSVCPPLAAAIVAANYQPQRARAAA